MSTNEKLGTCDCKADIERTEIPGKVIILTCRDCKTTYTLYPDGTISYEQPTSYQIGF